MKWSALCLQPKWFFAIRFRPRSGGHSSGSHRPRLMVNNNAGVNRDGMFHEMERGDRNAVLRVDLRSMFNAVAPGYADTPWSTAAPMIFCGRSLKTCLYRASRNRIKSGAASGFFAPDDASFITRATLAVNGGLRMTLINAASNQAVNTNEVSYA